MSVPLLSFFAALHIGKSGDRGIFRQWGWLVVPWAVILGVILTNDYHSLAYSFSPDSLETEHGLFYYISSGWQAVLSFATLAVSIARSRVVNIRKYAWIPLSLLLFGLLLFVLYDSNGGNALTFSKVYLDFQPVYAFVAIGYWLSCTAIGLLPLNSDYDTVFEHSRIKAQILNESGQVIYKSDNSVSFTKAQGEAAKTAPVMLNENTRLSVNAINGGNVYYTDDVTQINTLNENLMDAAELIAEENIITEEENRIKREKATLEAQNVLYDKMAFELTPTLKTIQGLVDKKDFATACVLGAYVKRRANLYILSNQKTEADVTELALAVNESLSYMKLLKIEGYCFCDAEITLDTSVLLSAYDFFESVIEENLKSFKNAMVVVNDDCLNIDLDGETYSYPFEKDGDKNA